MKETDIDFALDYQQYLIQHIKDEAAWATQYLSKCNKGLIDALVKKWEISPAQIIAIGKEGARRGYDNNEVLRDILQALKNGDNIDYITQVFFNEPTGHPHFIYMSSNKALRKEIFQNEVSKNDGWPAAKFVVENGYLSKSYVKAILEQKGYSTKFLDQFPDSSDAEIADDELEALLAEDFVAKLGLNTEEEVGTLGDSQITLV